VNTSTAFVDGLRARARLLAQTRDFFAARDVLEVTTPLLGAATVTDPDVSGIAVPGYGFLQTSPEYFLKRLLVQGAPSCYQLAPAFRADERGRLHNPEFMMLEWYRLGFDDRALMQEVRELLDTLLGPAEVSTKTYAQVVGLSDAEISRMPRDALDLAFANGCEALTPGRFFVVDYPADQAALAQVRQVNGVAVAARFELVIDGVEIANGYFELQEAEEHRQRFARDREVRQARGLPDQAIDEAFLDALEEGLPSCAGVALGIDRLVMLAMGARELDATMTFRDS